MQRGNETLDLSGGFGNRKEAINIIRHHKVESTELKVDKLYEILKRRNEKNQHFLGLG